MESANLSFRQFKTISSILKDGLGVGVLGSEGKIRELREEMAGEAEFEYGTVILECSKSSKLDYSEEAFFPLQKPRTDT